MAIIVYGAGFYLENSAWKKTLSDLTIEQTNLWVTNFDPKSYLAQVHIPTFWATSTKDFAFPLDSWQKSYQLTHGLRVLRIIPDWPHNYQTPWQTSEFQSFADQLLKDGPTLPKVIGPFNNTNNEVSFYYASSRPIVSVTVHFTATEGSSSGWVWQTAPALHLSPERRIDITLPIKATRYFINATTTDGLVVSSQIVNLNQEFQIAFATPLPDTCFTKQYSGYC